MLDKLARINIYVLSPPAALVIGFAIFILVVVTDYPLLPGMLCSLALAAAVLTDAT